MQKVILSTVYCVNLYASSKAGLQGVFLKILRMAVHFYIQLFGDWPSAHRLFEVWIPSPKAKVHSVLMYCIELDASSSMNRLIL
jgi:hypothetical protein